MSVEDKLYIKRAIDIASKHLAKEIDSMKSNMYFDKEHQARCIDNWSLFINKWDRIKKELE